MRPRVTGVPVTLVTGYLGVGKTTALRELLRHRPAGERWAVVVNEFGEIGIDGALLDEDGGYVVREIPGGCICCSSGVQLQVHLARLLREQRPDRVLVEPTGIASPASILDLLRRPGMAEATSVRAVITLVEPRRLLRPPHLQEEAFLAQVEVADVLVANKVDLATPEELDGFRRAAGALWPPKLVIAETTQGVLDPAWLELDPSPERMARVPVDPHLDDPHLHAHDTHDLVSAGWVFPPDVVFDSNGLREVVQGLVVPNDALREGVVRLKGVFRTDRAWVMVQADDSTVSFQPFQHRRDSRVEVIAPATPAPDWEAVEALLRGAVRAVG